MSLDQIEFMKRMKAIASDLWGGGHGVDLGDEPEAEEKPAEEKPREEEKTREEKREKKIPRPFSRPALDVGNLWKTADETVDWTDALAHTSPSDGLTGPKMWNFYHQHAEGVLAGDVAAYTEVLQKSNPLGELTEFAEGINMRAPDPDRLESTFTCKGDLLEKHGKLYLSALGLRIARDLLACLPVSEVAVTGEYNGETVYSATFTRQQLLHRNFAFVDPVALSEECGAAFNIE